MRRSSVPASLALASLLLIPLACSNPPSPGPGPGPGPEPFVPDDVGAIPLSNELAGRQVQQTEEGPWAMRRAVSADAERRSDGVATASRSVRPKARSFGGEVLGGAAAPADSAAAEPSRSPVADPRADAHDGMDRGGDVEERESGDMDVGEDKSGGPPVGERARGVAGKKAKLEADFEGGSRTKMTSNVAPAQQLKAGSTDDNVDFEAYLEFLQNWPQKDVMRAGYQPLDVRNRKYIRVLDANDRPVPGAVVGVTDVDADRRIATLTTYGDGRAPFYPHVAGNAGAETVPVPTSGYVVEALVDGKSVRTTWDAHDDELVLRLEQSVAAPEMVRLDALFLIDTTGSMGDEIASIKASLLKVTEQLRSLEREFDLRYGAVLFRDIGDQYLTATHPFTSDIASFDKALKAVEAGGGGDGPESVNQGLAQAVDGVSWRGDAAKVVFLIGDAPPHMDYPGDTWYGESLRAAVAKGIRIHSVAASGLDARGTLVWRQIAQFTRGKFIFIEYGGAAKSAASHGVAGKVKSNNLEDILFEQIRDEVAHFGR